jgi:hypothetical protein
MAEPDSNATDLLARSGSVSKSDCVGPLLLGARAPLARIERKARSLFLEVIQCEDLSVGARFAGEGA